MDSGGLWSSCGPSVVQLWSICGPAVVQLWSSCGPVSGLWTRRSSCCYRWTIKDWRQSRWCPLVSSGQQASIPDQARTFQTPRTFQTSPEPYRPPEPFRPPEPSRRPEPFRPAQNLSEPQNLPDQIRIQKSLIYFYFISCFMLYHHNFCSIFLFHKISSFSNITLFYYVL